MMKNPIQGKEEPYALLVRGNVPVVARHSHMDVTQPDMTLMTTIAYESGVRPEPTGI